MAVELPEDGDLLLGAVRLPSGRRVGPDGYGPVAWVTATAVPDPGPAWSALLDMHPRTGLVPVLIDAGPDGTADDLFVPEFFREFFREPTDPREIDAADPVRVLAERWDGVGPRLPRFAGHSSDFIGPLGPGEWPSSISGILSALVGMISDHDQLADLEWLKQADREQAAWPAARARRFPGLAPAVYQRLSTAERTAALAQLGPARICLVPVARPADVIAATGWRATGQFTSPPTGVPAGAVLRSWEDRFGAQLLMLGPGAGLGLLVDRPPRTRATAEPIAIEHLAFADDFLADEFRGEGKTSIGELADALVNRPIWQFWGK